MGKGIVNWLLGRVDNRLLYMKRFGAININNLIDYCNLILTRSRIYGLLITKLVSLS